MTTKALLLGGAMGALVVLAPATVAAQAVTTPAAAGIADTPAVEEIIVTGSRIRRDPLAQESPVVVIDAEAIQRTGLSAVADIL